MVLERLKVGTHVFIIESHRIATEVTITARRGNFYTLKFQNGGAIQLRRNRIFLSKEDAEKSILRKTASKYSIHSPYDHGM